MVSSFGGVWHTVATVLHLCICVLLVLIVLLQQGKGADAGATFGGGSNTVFGAGGADTVLTKVTTVLAFLFMATSFTLAIQGNWAAASGGGRLFRDAPVKSETTSPQTALPQEGQPA